MSRVLRSLLVTASFALAAAAYAEESPQATPKIDQTTLLKRIERKDASLIVLDVRTPEEFRAGHIPGAVNIPYNHLPARISELPDASDKDIVVYCAVGVRAEQGAERLRENGFTRLLHLDGDMQAWQEKKLPEAKR